MTGVIVVHVPCPDAATAATIAEDLLTQRLVACAHAAPAIRSRYHWKGAIERALEVPLTLTTRADLFDAVAAAVRALHPYEVPAILAQPVTATPDYAAWVAAETRDEGDA